MEIKGSLKERKASTLYVGWALSDVVAICPTNNELRALGLNIADDKDEPVYTGKNESGVDTARVQVFFKEETSGYIFNKPFFLEKTQQGNKAGDKLQYVNSVGDSTWVDDSNNLQDRFTKFTKKNKNTGEVEVYGDKKWRVANKGEASLLEFIRVWLNNINYMDADTNILIDVNKLFKGDFKELKSQVGSQYADKTVELLEVKSVDGDGEIKQYQAVNKKSLCGYTYKVIKNTSFTPSLIKSWVDEKKTKDNPDGRYLKAHEEFCVELVGEYGTKNYYQLVPFTEYDESKNFMAASVVEITDTGSDY